jgi:hypothetical protein
MRFSQDVGINITNWVLVTWLNPSTHRATQYISRDALVVGGHLDTIQKN